ncbi:MAG: hypothetical protein JRG89_07700 [Deltaproteobacteria bacterium]|nr:hypothetical protein [Deltaproteobacteria bacterium]
MKLRSRVLNIVPGLSLLALTLLVGSVAFAEEAAEKPAKKSAAEIAQELSNPTTAVASITSNLNFTEFDGDLPGADGQRGWSYLLQPSIPFPQGNGKNVLFRPAITIFGKQPVPDGGGGYKDRFELGDIGFDLAYGGVFGNLGKLGGLLLLGGMVGSIPTATDDSVGTDQWHLGPEALVGMIGKWGVAGVLVSHQWGLENDDDLRTNITGGQYFVAIPILDKTWQLFTSPTFSYNHELDGEKWTLPVGGGLSKTTIIDGRVWKFSFQYWNYVKSRDDFGPEHLIRFTIAPVIDLPWGG